MVVVVVVVEVEVEVEEKEVVVVVVVVVVAATPETAQGLRGPTSRRNPPGSSAVSPQAAPPAKGWVRMTRFLRTRLAARLPQGEAAKTFLITGQHLRSSQHQRQARSLLCCLPLQYGVHGVHPPHSVITQSTGHAILVGRMSFQLCMKLGGSSAVALEMALALQHDCR